MTRDEIIKRFVGKTGKINGAVIRYITQPDIDTIINMTSFLVGEIPLRLRLRCIIDSITEHPRCENCGNLVRPRHNGLTFSTTCSYECSQKNPNRISKIIKNTDYQSRNKKTKETNLERYGVGCYFQIPEVAERNSEIRKNHPNKADIYKRSSDTRNRNYPKGSSEYREMMERQIDSRFITVYGTSSPDFTDPKIISKTMLECGGFVLDAATKLNVSFSCLYLHIHKNGLEHLINKICGSKGEYEVSEYIKSLGFDIINGSRNLIKPYELDLYVPDRNFAIEFDGLYWHCESSNSKDKTYHVNKTNLCENKNIRLFHIFDNEWNNITKRDIWKSMISNALGKTPYRIYARKCAMQQVSPSDVKKFMEDNHLQGFRPAKLHLGLYYENELVSCMSVGKSRFAKDCEWEIIRFANKKYTNVLGGASRLLKHMNLVGKIVSYADRRHSQGDLYRHLGFIRQKNSSPSYFYTKDYCNLESRMKFQRHKLTGDGTEWEIMKSLGYDRIWDCGTQVWKK